MRPRPAPPLVDVCLKGLRPRRELTEHGYVRSVRHQLCQLEHRTNEGTVYP